MDLLASTWRIVFGGVTLLDHGDHMASEPEMPWEAKGETVAPVNAAFALQFAYGNATNTISFSRVLVFSEAGAARAALAQHNALLPPGVHDAGITPLGGDACTLAGARLLPCRPRLTDGCRLVCEYTLVGGAIAFDGLSDDALSPGFTFADDAA